MPLNFIGQYIPLPWEQEVECSNHSAPTSQIEQKAKYLHGVWLLCFFTSGDAGSGVAWSDHALPEEGTGLFAEHFPVEH